MYEKKQQQQNKQTNKTQSKTANAKTQKYKSRQHGVFPGGHQVTRPTTNPVRKSLTTLIGRELVS